MILWPARSPRPHLQALGQSFTLKSTCPSHHRRALQQDDPPATVRLSVLGVAEKAGLGHENSSHRSQRLFATPLVNAASRPFYAHKACICRLAVKRSVGHRACEPLSCSGLASVLVAGRICQNQRARTWPFARPCSPYKFHPPPKRSQFKPARSVFLQHMIVESRIDADHGQMPPSGRSPE